MPSIGFRSKIIILEAYVDLVNLANAPRYGYAIELSYLREWRKLLQEAKLGKNEYLSNIYMTDRAFGELTEYLTDPKPENRARFMNRRDNRI